MSSSNYTLTPNLGLYKPNYDMDDGQWGAHLNANADALDSAIHFASGGGPFLPLAGGIVSGDVHVTQTLDADTGYFGGAANLAQRNAALDASSGVTTWVGHDMLYYDLCSLASFYPQPGSQCLGVVAAVRSSDAVPLTPGRPASIAFAAFAKADADQALPNSGSAFCYYGSARKLPNSLPVFLAELSMGNLDPAQPDINPWQAFPPGASHGIWMSSGSEAFEAGETVYPAGVALAIGSNGTTWAKGIVFMHDGLTPAPTTGIMKAMQLPTKAEIQWTFDVTGARSGFIRSDATAANPGIVFKSGSFNVTDNAETVNLLQVSAAGASVTGGLHLAGIVGASNADVTKHIELYTGAGYGFGVTAGSLNYVVPASAIHTFVVNAVTVGTLTSTGLNFCAVGATGASTGNFTQVAVSGTKVVGAQITGWGTSTGGVRGAITASSTLPQVAAALAQLLTDLKTHGMIGT